MDITDVRLQIYELQTRMNLLKNSTIEYRLLANIWREYEYYLQYLTERRQLITDHEKSKLKQV